MGPTAVVLASRIEGVQINPVYDPTLTVPAHILEAARTIGYYFEEQGVRSWELQGICSRKRVWELEEEVRRAYNQPPVTLGLMASNDDPYIPADVVERIRRDDERSWLACEDKLAEALLRLSKTQEALLKFLQDNLGAAKKQDLEELGKKIMPKLSELAGLLTAVKDQATRSRDEILKKILDLETTLGDVELPAEATAALEALKAEVQSIDDIAEAKG